MVARTTGQLAVSHGRWGISRNTRPAAIALAMNACEITKARGKLSGYAYVFVIVTVSRHTGKLPRVAETVRDIGSVCSGFVRVR